MLAKASTAALILMLTQCPARLILADRGYIPSKPEEFRSVAELDQLVYAEVLNSSYQRISMFLSFASLDGRRHKGVLIMPLLRFQRLFGVV